ncbi:N-acetylmuramoyl-L-alanine amidase [Virgibacillus phasianinus]|uniref:N-acetylmuramoyl-L-alanine amidase n=1 Tax=Virgibacillus phasianinus TaxID=2017483 RepID=A0A220U367_9BACI|nr:N-acetylmuramoyl-L-alanine amidase [Virgibacillus phasianinus]ASK62261.1 N-acetylmuramoyl-L-alanine amidase [Virgibacillus phasianinus]
MRLLTAGIGFMLLFFVFIPAVYADSGSTTYQVGVSTLNVRSQPSDRAPVIGQLKDGDSLVVFQEAFGWAQTYYGGKVGWVASQFLYQTENSGSNPAAAVSGATSEQQVTVTASGVRIRTGPGTSYTIIGHTSNGHTYSLVNTANGWNEVVLDDGTTGWIAGWLTDSGAAGTTASVKNDPPTAVKSAASAKRSLAGYNIVLDPGHGGKDPGALGIGGTLEKDVILDTAENVAQRLRAAGATVIMTRDSDHFLSLEERVLISSKFNTHAFISLHYNAYPFMGINGISTHYYAGGNDRELAQDIQTGLRHNVSLNSRGIMQSNYHVLRENSDLAVLVELGFITNPSDLTTVQTESYQNNAARGIVEGVKAYFH